MRTDLEQPFIDELNAVSSSPRLLVEFNFKDQTVYVSDQFIDKGDVNPTIEYLPIIKSWGSLRDNVRIAPIISGDSIETRQITISLINNTENFRFSDLFGKENPENVKVYVYQWFANMPFLERVLIDIFICQDPIKISENSGLITLDLVSPIMGSNNYIYGPNRELEVRYPYIVGKKQVECKRIVTQEAPLATLTYDMDSTTTDIIYSEGENTFPAGGGIIWIDSEQISYSSFDIAVFTVTARGVGGTTARPHVRGALITLVDAPYDYSVSAGPVGKIDNLLADGVPYVHNFTPQVGGNPAFLRFLSRPPYHSVESGAPGPPITFPPETIKNFGILVDSYADIVPYPVGIQNINNETSTFQMDVDHTVGGDITGPHYGTAAAWGPDDQTPEHTPENINDPDISKWFKISGGNTFGNDLPAGARMYIRSTFGRDLSGPDKVLKAVLVRMKFQTMVQDYAGNMTVYLDVEGTRHILFQENFNTISATVPKTNDENMTFNVSSIIDTYAKLQSAGFGVMITIDTRGSGSGTMGQEIRIEVAEWKVTYSDSSSDPTFPVQEVMSGFGQDKSALGTFGSVKAEVTFNANPVDGTEISQDILYRTNTIPGGSSLWERTTSVPVGMYRQTVDLPVTSWTDLKNSWVGLHVRVNSPSSPGSRRQSYTTVHSVRWVITYTPPEQSTPEEQRVIYVTQLLADVTALAGEDVTPPKIVQGLLEDVGDLGGYIDETNFREMDNVYKDNNFYMKGSIDGSTKLHEGLRSVLRQGMLRLIYNSGRVKIVSELFPAVNPPVTVFSKDDIKMRAITDERMRFESIINSVVIQYSPNFDNSEYLGEVEKELSDSIAEIGEQRKSLQYPLIYTSEIADLLADRMLNKVGYPKVFTTFRAYMKAFPLEKEDLVFVETDFNDYLGMTGNILTINRIFGNAVLRKMNLFEITIDTTPIEKKIIEIVDTINTEDTVEFITAVSTTINIVDDIGVEDVVQTWKPVTVVVTIIDEINASEVLETTVGLIVKIEIVDTMNASEIVNTTVEQTGYGLQGYGSSEYGN